MDSKSLPNAKPDLIVSNAFDAIPTAIDIVMGSITILH